MAFLELASGSYRRGNENVCGVVWVLRGRIGLHERRYAHAFWWAAERVVSVFFNHSLIHPFDAPLQKHDVIPCFYSLRNSDYPLQLCSLRPHPTTTFPLLFSREVTRLQ